jgi:hypothetical protein
MVFLLFVRVRQSLSIKSSTIRTNENISAGIMVDRQVSILFASLDIRKSIICSPSGSSLWIEKFASTEKPDTLNRRVSFSGAIE